MDPILPIRVNWMLKVFLLPAAGGTGAVLVDTGMPKMADRILAATAQQGFEPGDLRLILITHAHVDHIGSVRELHARTGAPIAIHRGDAAELRRSLASSGAKDGLPSDALIVFDEDWRLDDYGVAAQVLHTPGHSPGSITILLDSGEMIIGDMLRGRPLRAERPAPPFIAANLQENWRSLARVLALAPQQIHVSHWGPIAPGEAQRFLAKVRKAPG